LWNYRVGLIVTCERKSVEPIAVVSASEAKDGERRCEAGVPKEISLKTEKRRAQFVMQYWLYLERMVESWDWGRPYWRYIGSLRDWASSKASQT